jgi:hypothetical protein
VTASSDPPASLLRWAWTEVGRRAGTIPRGELPAPVAPEDGLGAAARAMTVLIASLARRLAGADPPEQWVPDLVAWLLADGTHPEGVVDGDDPEPHDLVAPGPPDLGWKPGLPLAAGVLVAAVTGHELPDWVDQHGGTMATDLPALSDLTWALAYALDAHHRQPGLADTTVADLLDRPRP